MSIGAQPSSSGHLDSAVKLSLAGEHTEAIEEFQKALDAGEFNERDPVYAWYDWGVSLLALQKYSEAAEKYTLALKIDPDYVAAYSNRGACYAALKLFDKAIENYEAAVRIDPNYEMAVRNWGNSLFRQRKYEAALAKYQRATEINPKFADAWISQIQTLRMLGRLREAEGLSEVTARSVPPHAGILRELSQVYFGCSDFETAVKTLDLALALEPANREIWKEKLSGLKPAWDLSLAEKAASEALAVFPDDAEIASAVAQLYRDQSRYEKAEEAFRTAWELNERKSDSEATSSQSVEILIERGSLYLTLRRIDRAEQQFDEALQRKNSSYTISFKVYFLRQCRRFDEAEKMLAKELAEGAPNSQNVSLLNQRGLLCVDRTQYQEAVEAFLQAPSGNDEALQGILAAHRSSRNFAAADRVWSEEVVKKPSRNLPAALIRERCDFYADQWKFDEGIAFCLEQNEWSVDAVVRRISFLSSSRRFDEAEEVSLTALKRWPGSTDIISALSWVYFNRRDYQKAAEWSDKILKNYPLNDGALECKAHALRLQGPKFYDAAESLLTRPLAFIPGNAIQRYVQAQIRSDREQLAEAEQSVSQAVANAQPAYLEPFTFRMQLLEQLNRGDEARALLEQFQAERPNDIEVINQAGWFYLGRNEVFAALKQFEAIQRIDSRHIHGINGLGAVCFARGDFEKGVKYFEEAKDAFPNQRVLLTNLAWAAVRREDDRKEQPKKRVVLERFMGLSIAQPAGADKPDGYSEAEQLCREAQELDPKYAQSYTCLGTIAFKRGRMLESEDHLKASIRASAREGGWVDLGALYVAMGRYEEAETNLKKAMELSRSDSRARIELGNLYLLTKRESEGIRLFREALSIDRFSPEPPRALALALQRQGDLQEAAGVLRKAIANLDENQRWQLHLTLAQILTEVGDKAEDPALYDDALKEIQIAIELKPSSAEALFRAGIIWYRMENYQKAKKKFRECLEINPNHVEADRNLRTVAKLVRQEVGRARSIRWLGILLGVFCLAGTVAMWWLYFHFRLEKDKPITAGMLTGLTPTLVAIAACAFLFPYVVHLKFPGVEAELSQPEEKISKGPTGQLSK